MRYHNITKDDMLNGDGLRVVLVGRRMRSSLQGMSESDYLGSKWRHPV